MYRFQKYTLFSIFFLTAALLIGCAGEDYTYEDSTELQPGPGLLSGEDGVFTIYGAPNPPEKESPSTDTTEEQP